MTIIIAFINHLSEKVTLRLFINGASKMLKVVLIISFACGIVMLAKKTHLDNYFLYNIVNSMENSSLFMFTPLNYLLNMIVSIFNSDVHDVFNAVIPASISSDLELSVLFERLCS